MLWLANAAKSEVTNGIPNSKRNEVGTTGQGKSSFTPVTYFNIHLTQ